MCAKYFFFTRSSLLFGWLGEESIALSLIAQLRAGSHALRTAAFSSQLWSCVSAHGYCKEKAFLIPIAARLSPGDMPMTMKLSAAAFQYF